MNARDISFKVSKRDSEAIAVIVERALILARRAGIEYDGITARMDITAVHANGTPLRLQELADADDLNFAHDILGIRRHLNRDTAELGGCFVPRFAYPRDEVQS